MADTARCQTGVDLRAIFTLRPWGILTGDVMLGSAFWIKLVMSWK